MTKKYEEHPLGKLSDEELDQILENYGSDYSAKNKENIKRKAKMKTRQPVVKVTFSKSRLLLVAVIVLFFLPVGTYVAAKLWEINVEKKNYELTTKIDKPTEQQLDTGYYRLEAEYVPSYLTVDDKSAELFLYEDIGIDEPETDEDFEALSKTRNVSFALYELNEKDTVVDEYVKDYKEIKLSDRKAYMIEQTDTYGNTMGAIARMFFEKQNMFVQVMWNGDIPQKDIEEIMDNLSLVSVDTMEEATSVAEYMSSEDNMERIAGISQGIEPLALDINNKSELVQLNESIQTADISGSPMQEVTVTKVTLSDMIAPETLSILNERLKVGTSYDLEYNVEWDKKGKLKPFTATEFSRGDGKNTLNEEIRELKIKPKYLEIELNIKNVSDKTVDYSFYAQVRRLAEKEGGFTDVPYETNLVRKDLSNPITPYIDLIVVYYPLPTVVGKIVDHVVEEESDSQPIEPGETITVTGSFLLAGPSYDNLFLNLNYVTPNKYIQLTE